MQHQAKKDHRRQSENDATELRTLPSVHLVAFDAIGAQRCTENDRTQRDDAHVDARV